MKFHTTLLGLSLFNTALSLPSLADDSSLQPRLSEWRSHGLLRIDLADPRLDEKLISPEVAGQTGLLDFNLTGKRQLFEGLTFQADVDAFARRSWNFSKRDPQTRAVVTTQGDTSENPAYRMALNEFYLNGEALAGYQYVVGKKRILWGTGFAANPTDLLNPTKNPLDPTYERRGAWLMQAEHVQENQTFAFLFAPMVLEDKNTLPTDFSHFRDADGERRAHYLFGTRWYRLLGGADVNFMAFYSERFKGDNAGTWKGGASWSQILEAIHKQLEGHGEVIIQRGSSRPNPFGESRLGVDEFYIKSLLGIRYDFENESSLVLEILHQGDGDSIADLEERLQKQIAALSRNPNLSAKTSDLFANQIQMRNSLYLNWQRYKFNDDVFLSWAVAHNLHDHSGYQGPILQWTPTQSESFTLVANTDYTLKKDSGVQLGNVGRRRVSELNPVKSRFSFEFKSYF
ncbi:MAG: hypothetical protein ACO3A4_14570 [Silvanigrellaceae bacterium]